MVLIYVWLVPFLLHKEPDINSHHFHNRKENCYERQNFWRVTTSWAFLYVADSIASGSRIALGLGKLSDKYNDARDLPSYGNYGAGYSAEHDFYGHECCR